MNVILHPQEIPDARENGCAVAMGYFDGLHIGHAAVIGAAVNWAKKENASPAVFTFQLNRDDKLKGKRLLPTKEKHRLAEEMGVQFYVAPPFSEIRGMSAEEFVDFLIDKMHAKALFCGNNFTFGAKAAGTPELLEKLCAPRGVEVVVVPMARYEGKNVSSTRIRTALAGGDMPAVNGMLGRRYAISFAVEHGEGLGSKLGVPTINQHFPKEYQLPRYGIYITKTYIDGKWYPSATGLGTRPTVNNDTEKVSCETFIPNFHGDLYGKKPMVEFYTYLCPSKKFDTLEELKQCIVDAAQQSKEYFG